MSMDSFIVKVTLELVCKDCGKQFTMRTAHGPSLICHECADTKAAAILGMEK